MNKKYIPVFFTVFAIIIATFFWEKIALPYNFQNEIHGEYAINHYNANNDNFRFIFFISFPLSIFLLSYLLLNKENTFSFKEVLLNKGEKTEKHNSNLFFILFLIYLIFEFLSINFSRFSSHLDFFHDGSFLTPSNNLYFTKGLWSSTFIEYGLFGNYQAFISWSLSGLKTIGSLRLSELIFLLSNKVLLVILSKKVSENLIFNDKIKILYFILLSTLSISLVSYKDNIGASEFPIKTFLFLLFILFFFNSLYKSNKFSPLFFLLGLFSVISMLWYIDIGAYINVLLLFILIYFFLRKELKKFLSTLLGIFFGWLIFVFIIPDYELKEFVSNTLLIYSSYDYIIGLIYPTPFLSGDTRTTRILLLIILSGVLLIIVNFNKNTKLTYYNKTIFVFIFISALLIFKTGITRADTPHIKAASGFTLFLLYSLGLYFLFYYILGVNKNNTFFLKFTNLFVKKYTNFIFVFFIIFFLSIKNDTININNILSSPKEMSKLIKNKDEKYLSAEYLELVKHYKDLTAEETCVQILTNESALPYFMKKPTCTPFYLMWNSGPNQKKFVERLKKTKPKIILYSSDIDPYNDVFERTPQVMKYVDQNYSFHSKFKSWSFVKINTNE